MNDSQVRNYSALIRRQTTLFSAGKALADSAQALGWNLAAFHLDIEADTLPRARDGNYIAHAMGWPASYLRQWTELEMGRHCPVGRLCIGATDPVYWTCDTGNALWEGRNITTEQRQVLEFYGELLSGGVAVPVQRGGGKTGYVSWCSYKSDILRQRLERSVSSAFMLSHIFIQHAARLNSARSGPGEGQELSARERECLAWAARGKTEQEIGLMLYRSAATVHFHLRNAMIKLNAGNRTHAVAIACTRGLISAD